MKIIILYFFQAALVAAAYAVGRWRRPVRYYEMRIEEEEST